MGVNNCGTQSCVLIQCTFDCPTGYVAYIGKCVYECPLGFYKYI